LKGSIQGVPVRLESAETETDSGVAEASAEINHPLFSSKAIIEPLFSIGLTYEFKRPNDGLMLTGDLRYNETSAWSGLARTGVRR
jgi:hypothetical protein